MLKLNYKKYKIWILVAVLVLANFFVLIFSRQIRAADHMQVSFFDVGQGDATHIRTPNGNDVVIDGGPGDRILSKISQTMPVMDKNIELLVITHPHADHVSGAIQLLRRYKVETVLVSDLEYSSQTYQIFLDELEKQQIDIIRPKTGMRIFADSAVVIDVLYPVTGKFENPPKDVNQASTILRVSFGTSNILFPADADKENENWLISRKLPLESEVLKVGHQGSLTSTSEQFVDKVSPEHAVIMVGENSYGHPHSEVLDLLNRNQIEVFRTDEHGDVLFKIYPNGIEKIK